jgi:asparagine synthase (glutamine-hydrolysing)
MCGIVGILGSLQPPDSTRSELERMLSTLVHRGPDEWGTYVSNGCSLGQMRLSIIDLATGCQPMSNERSVIVYNGELYNYPELREDLRKRGHVFHTTSDTEVVLEAIDEYGLDAFAKFNGQFAICLWDRRSRRLIVARDRFGVRPLYVTTHNGATYFASEMKAFDVLPGFTRTFDPDNLFIHALLWNTLGDSTVYRGIRSVEPGTCEVYENGTRIKVHRYYSLGEKGEKFTGSFSDASDRFTELLRDSVHVRLRSDVPVGAYLSGGIDSSVTTLLAARENTQPVESFSVTFEDPALDESAYQREVVEKLGTRHHFLSISHESIAENFSDAIYHGERPIFRTAPTPLFLLSAKVREQGFKVVLTGEAADEILYGYDSFKELSLLRFWNRNPGSRLRPTLLRKLYPHLRHYADPKRFGLLRLYYEGFLPDFDSPLAGHAIRVHNNSVMAKYLNPGLGVSFVKDAVQKYVESALPSNAGRWSLLQRNQYLEMRTLLAGYLLSSQGDRMSMAHSVEGRYPFLDHRLVDFVFSLPDRFKLNGFEQKWLLRKAYEQDLPASIINRPKMPYQAPDLKAFYKNGMLRTPAAEILSQQSIRDYGIFNEVLVGRLISRYQRIMPEQIGYRDNMIFVFALSAHLALHHARHPRLSALDPDKRTVNIIEKEMQR